MTSAARRVLLDSADVNRTIARIAHQIIEKTALDDDGDKHVVLLGIPTRGPVLASRFAAKVAEFSGIEIPTGFLDTTLYRDDLRGQPHRPLERTTVPAGGIDNAHVILVDDVLYSGRTVRAALDALRDLGRPATVQLAVLVDRGHRELPIRADYVGKNLPTARDEDVAVHFTETDGVDEVVLGPRDTTAGGSA
ncbi:bifunctional pyr operon transcriptional regulator/uracil phosphoribosyltransferase PyrR [Gordonia crocea]|uniref:Bifunctional protein PyrR n=1 Tax=Gordonia crocea TaxID=589162 RepID=A0A7I9UXH3_9ACTN|nr:bifunctional pyr operon transcriptional regulator/uracil phosphoribosyltransferase PyrR [Gordonia crocea]GED97897.1 bifunctional protein PyrR [Gordonia crocea]